MIAASGILCAAQAVAAGESGSFSYVASLVYDYTTLEHAGQTFTGGPLHGTVFSGRIEIQSPGALPNNLAVDDPHHHGKAISNAIGQRWRLLNARVVDVISNDDEVEDG